MPHLLLPRAYPVNLYSEALQITTRPDEGPEAYGHPLGLSWVATCVTFGRRIRVRMLRIRREVGPCDQLTKRRMDDESSMVHARCFLHGRCSVFLSTPVGALAQRADDSGYPTHPIRFIVPAAPGGTTDTLARLFGAKMTDELHEQVVVDNRASASGVLAADLVAHAEPDGYTLFLPYLISTL